MLNRVLSRIHSDTINEYLYDTLHRIWKLCKVDSIKASTRTRMATTRTINARVDQSRTDTRIAIARESEQDIADSLNHVSNRVWIHEWDYDAIAVSLIRGDLAQISDINPRSAYYKRVFISHKTPPLVSLYDANTKAAPGA
jgi:hypothetical protein